MSNKKIILNTPKRSAVQVTVDISRNGQRLDNFLMAQLRLLPKSYIYRIIRSGEVRINSKRAKPSDRLVENDLIRIPPLHIKNKNLTKVSPDIAQAMQSHIIFEDDGMIVINKPAGLSVHSGSGHNYGLIDLLKVLRPDDDVALAHRLDKDVSGCLLVAKTRPALLYLHRIIRQHEIEKIYSALVVGHWKNAKTIKTHLVRQAQKQIVGEHGKEAISYFDPISYFNEYTLMSVRILTGRTHQIRVHASNQNHPIVGDRKYGDFKINRQLREQGLQRIFLHSSQISFEWDKKRKTFSTELPDDLQRLLNCLDMR